MQRAGGADVALRDAVEATPDGVRLLLDVRPGSARSGFEGFHPWRGRIVVAVRAPPQGGQANREVLEIVAQALRVEAAAVRIAAGARGRRKTVQVAGVDRALALETLDRLVSKG